MCDEGEWQDISPAEVAMVHAIISESRIPEGRPLLNDLPGAVVLRGTVWIFDLRTSNSAAGAPLPNGPFPARAFVQTLTDYRGEILLWITDGHLSALEYAWVTDDPPTRWPRPDEMEIIAQEDSGTR